MFAVIRWWEFQAYCHAQCTAVQGPFCHSCKIIGTCSDDVRNHAQWIVHSRAWTGTIQTYKGFHGLLTDIWCNQAKIISESISHNYTINIYHTGGCTGSCFSRAQEDNGCIAPHTGFSSIVHPNFIGQKVQAYHSYRNKSYILHSQSNDCAWGTSISSMC